MGIKGALIGELEAVLSLGKDIGKDYVFGILNGSDDTFNIPEHSEPVVNYHGFFVTHRCMAGIATHEKKEGFTPFVRAYNWWGDLEMVGFRRSKALNEFCQKTGRKASLVGHSEGGLIALMKAQIHPELVDKVIILGTPLQGTPMARAGFFVKSCQQMTPGSDFLKMLHERGFPGEVEYHAIASSYDEIVFPISTSLLPEDTYSNVHNHIVKGVGHAGLIGPRCYNLVTDILKGER